LFLSSGVLLFVHAFLSVGAPRLAAVTLFLHLAVFGSATVSGFWSLVNERYDPHSAKRVIGRLAGAATAGGLLAGLVAWQAASRMSIAALLVAMGVLNLTCWVGVLGMGKPASTNLVRRSPGADDERAPLVAAIRVFNQAPYLRQLASLVTVAAVASALMDYFLGVRAKALYATSSDLLSFFALFQLGVGLLSFVVLSALSKPSLKSLGLAGTVALLPGSLVLGGVAALALPSLWTAVALRATDAIFHNSLFRSGYELLFTPITTERKRATKLIIDVAFDRVGTAAGSGIAMFVVLVLPEHSERAIAVAVIALALLGLWISLRLHAGYVEALEQSLRAGTVQLDEAEVVDGTTWRTLTQTNLQLDRRKILAEIERLRRETAESPADKVVADAGEEGVHVDGRASLLQSNDPVVDSVAALRSQDAERIRKVLSEAEPLEPHLVSHVIPLLGRTEVRHEALHALRRAAPRAVGQMLDALLDPKTPKVVRRRLARVLRACPTQRVADGLLLGLADGSFDVRFQCGIALWTITEGSSLVELPRDSVLAAAQREVEVDREIWEAQACADVGESHEDSVVDELLSERKSRSLEHVFRILGLVLDREPLMLALRALEADDARLRGTSLEYLDNVLPDRIRAPLWPYLNDRRTAPAPRRPRQEIIDELLRSSSAMSVESGRDPGGKKEQG
jgi:hypothetical protein